MITKITPVNELKQIFLEILLNKTDLINDISEESVLNGIAYGIAKIGQKCLVNQAVVEGHIFPQTSYGEYLDNCAKLRGVSERFTLNSSTAYVKLIAETNTFYDKDIVQFKSLSGVVFELENSVTIDTNGFAYAKVRSVGTGAVTNVDPLTINSVSPTPEGHIAVTNEYAAEFGRDYESDDLYKIRIKESINVLSKHTVSYLEQILMKINKNVLRVFKNGYENGKMVITVISVNGQDFSSDEFNEMLSKYEQYATMSELFFADGTQIEYGIIFKNPQWMPIDVDFRVSLDESYDFDEIRKDIQIQMNKAVDYRFWNIGDKVEWENLLFCVKNVDGVKYVPDTHFYPQYDISVSKYKLPRLRGFVMRDLNGNIIKDNNNVLNDFYYPNSPDYNFQSSVLMTI